jgi:hypothetical protein
MQYGLERYAKEHPEVDILLVEPARDDLRMFSYHIMRYGARRVVAEHGYRSVMRLVEANFDAYRRMLRKHGLLLRRPSDLPALPEAPKGTTVARRLASSLRTLEKRLDASRTRAAR